MGLSPEVGSTTVVQREQDGVGSGEGARGPPQVQYPSTASDRWAVESGEIRGSSLPSLSQGSHVPGTEAGGSGNSDPQNREKPYRGQAYPTRWADGGGLPSPGRLFCLRSPGPFGTKRSRLASRRPPISPWPGGRSRFRVGRRKRPEHRLPRRRRRVLRAGREYAPNRRRHGHAWSHPPRNQDGGRCQTPVRGRDPGRGWREPPPKLADRLSAFLYEGAGWP